MGDKVYYWEMPASTSEDNEYDELSFYEISEEDEEINLNDVIKELESKLLGEKLQFADVRPKVSSVKRWIKTLMGNYPKKSEDEARYLLDTFRGSLYSRSREKERLVVGIILSKDILLLIHSKKDPSLAQHKDEIFAGRLVLHPKNILRAAIIRKEGENFIFGAYEYNRRWSKGHAEFWGIDPSYVNWEIVGEVILTIKIEGFEYPIQLSLDLEEINKMFKNNEISPLGKIPIAQTQGDIIYVDMMRKRYTFQDFYDLYVTRKEKLDKYKKLFRERISPHSLFSYDKDMKKRYRYIEDSEKLYEITPEGEKIIEYKNHPTYLICFFTDVYPGVYVKPTLLRTLYEAIFNNKIVDIWHAGEESFLEHHRIGGLKVYNILEISSDIENIANKILKLMKDSASIKERLIMQLVFSQMWYEHLKNTHFKVLFKYIIDDIIIPELSYQFKNKGIATTEKYLEFKSGDEVLGGPSKFVKKKLIPDIKSYINEDTLSRLAIIYGIEDNGEIEPLRHLKNDIITVIEEKANKILENEKIKIRAYSVPIPENMKLLLILIIPEEKMSVKM